MFLDLQDDLHPPANDRPRTIAVTAPFGNRGNGDPKLRQLAPLWRGLTLPAVPDPAVFLDILGRTAPGMTALIEWIASELSLETTFGDAIFRLPPLLLHGPPGVGKTHLARAIADAAAVPVRLVPLAGTSDVRTLLGTSAGYSTGSAGLAAQLMARTGCAAPVIILDEIDKVGTGTQNGNWHDALLPFLEPVSARGIFDEFLMTEIDLSRVTWIATANRIDGLPTALRSRFTTFEMDPRGQIDPSTLLDLAARGVATDLGLDPAEADCLIDRTLRDRLQPTRRTTLRVAKRLLRRALGLQLRGVRH